MIINTEMTLPLVPKKILRVNVSIVPSLNVVSIVDSSVSMDTHAAARLIALDAEKIGLLYFRYFTMLIMAMVNAVNVYVAIAMAVIS